MSALRQSVQVEEIDARASTSSVQTAAEIRVHVLPDKKLSEGPYYTSPARASSASVAAVLGPEVQHHVPALIKAPRGVAVRAEHDLQVSTGSGRQAQFRGVQEIEDTYAQGQRRQHEAVPVPKMRSWLHPEEEQGPPCKL
ncbi:uncharacterized protein LOC118646579 [Monomorium pharaonis]|uniref:uncharacterized protein LOC118646579 n=1 Tax=Monomorium pharaonis TaxID=307658 RepID=UPI00174779FD|nr:uncharacterized protein LOC118646579 [Monomorium pharaonis]